MLKIGDKTFLNLQEAVAWLMENNCIPFQCTAPYAANTEIGMGTIVNPSPAKVRIGSIIFFSDSKVSTVTGITQNGFMVSDKYNDLVDDVVYVSNVALNGSGHLIVTLSNGTAIDAGLVKQVSSFSINSSQHLIAHYNDGNSTDLGAIFSGNVVINGNLEVTGRANLPSLTSPNNYIEAEKPVIETMAGYSASVHSDIETYNWLLDPLYVNQCKNGNKLTMVACFKITKTAASSETYLGCIDFFFPSSIGNKLIPAEIGGYSYLDQKAIACFSAASAFITCPARMAKASNSRAYIIIDTTNFVQGVTYLIRYEATFLLSDSLV